MTKIEEFEKQFEDRFADHVSLEKGNSPCFRNRYLVEEVKSFYRRAITSLIEEVEEKINGLPHVFPEVESNDYDSGALRMKREVLALVNSYLLHQPTGEMRLSDVFISCGKLTEIPDKTFVGGCGEPVNIMKVYACVDCSAPFHRSCLLKHMTYDMPVTSLSKMPLKEALERVDKLDQPIGEIKE